MFRFSGLRHLCVIAFFLVISGCEKPPTPDDVIETYIQEWAEFYPSRAFSEGFKPAAGHFENFSEARVKAWVDYNHDIAGTLPAKLDKLSLDQKIDARVLLRQVRLEIERWDQDKPLRQHPQWYAEIISQALTYLLVREEITPEEKFQAVLKRLEGIRSLSRLGIKTLKNANRERTLGALETLDQTADFFDGNLPGLMRSWGPEDKQGRIEQATRQTARAVRDLARHIRHNILPNASLPVSFGREAYARKLKIHTDEAITPEDLASRALAEVGRVRDMMEKEAREWRQTPHGDQQKSAGDDGEILVRAIEAMENDREDNNQDFLALFIDLTAKAEQFIIDHDLATVPRPTTLYIALSPDHFSGAAVGGVYQAGPFAPNANTLFYLPSVPAGTPRKKSEGFYRSFNNHFNDMIISHEMFPGHYLQAKVAGIYASKIRALFANDTYVEGWGSFSETLMLDAGWADQDRLTRLAHLRKRLENATRAYVSVMVHTHGWDKKRLMDFATTRGLLAPQFAINLWRRVINSPLQLPTYFMGFHGFSTLWAQEQERRGGNFSTRDFVDGVLRAGPIPIEALAAVFQQNDKGKNKSDDSRRLSEFLDSVYHRRIAQSPMLAARLGVDENQDKWDDFSVGDMDKAVRRYWQDLRRLHKDFDYSKLNREAQLNYRAFEADLELRIERDSWRYHISPINQIVGLHLEMAGILQNSHKIEKSDDAEAYITRLKTAGRPIDQFIRFLKIREDKGFYLSKSVVPRLIDAAQSIIEDEPKDSNILFVDFARKIGKLDLPDADKTSLRAEMKQALRQHFIPAYQRLIQAFKDHQKLDITDQGAWHMPDGDKFYQFLLRQFTTTDITADDVHSYGLREVARIHREMEKIKNGVGFNGDLQSFFQHLKTSPEFYYPNTDQGRADYLADAREIVTTASSRVHTILTVPLPSDLVVKRMEAYREKSAPVAFYNDGTPDGKTPGTVFLNMYNMASVAKYDTHSLLYHEGIPGHHLQLSIMQAQKHIPDLRKYYVWWSNTAFTEGWALYAEYLAREMGLYNDPYAEFGRLAGELWRACRLVVDSGLHAKRWTRQEGIEFLNENTASSVENNARAVDRYLAVPGQATAFKIGMRKILQLREKARSRLQDKFDLREFHFVLLKNGPLPLNLLEAEVDDWIETKK